jgi:hypothetical protein
MKIDCKLFNIRINNYKQSQIFVFELRTKYKYLYNSFIYKKCLHTNIKRKIYQSMKLDNYNKKLIDLGRLQIHYLDYKKII